MDYVNLGRAGLKVSRICLGCMSYGDPGSGHHAWALNEADSRPFIRRALDLGINFFDTANMYSFGAGEEVLGRALRDFAKRGDVVIATKAFYPMRKGDPNSPGLSRKALFREVEDSLRRLGTDYIDLYQIHRWDYTTPIEETLEALHDIVKTGKARYIGASSMHAWQFAKALYLADLHGWTRFVSMQPHYNLIYREEEREMLPLCQAEGVGVIPWSPQARGRLSRPWKTGETERTRTDRYSRELYEASEAADREIIERVRETAAARGLPMSQIALAWILAKKAVTAPIVGATKPGQLEDAVAALSLSLSEEELRRLEEPYLPHRIAGLE
jgi:aryl-alcohol dehydrogenase-like predicted oxidoreductase